MEKVLMAILPSIGMSYIYWGLLQLVGAKCSLYLKVQSVSFDMPIKKCT